MRFKLLSCEIFRLEIALLLAETPHQVDVEFVPMQLHAAGKIQMKCRLAEYLHAADEEQYDALLLAYGLCSGGIAGLAAGTIPLVVPRAHDCITLFLGSRQRYQDYFFANGGTYFVTAGWLNADNALDDEPDMMPHYNKIAFIATGTDGESRYECRAQQIARDRHWAFERLPGNLSLLQRLITGDWDEDFLIVPPGQQIQMTYDDDVIST